MDASRISEPEYQTEIEEFDQKEFDSAKSLVHFLNKTLRSLLLYPKNNPIPKEFKRKLYQNFSDFLNSNEELKLEVKQSQFLYQGRIVYEEEEREQGITYALHKDGVRELVFIKELEQEELTHFLETLEIGLKSKDLEQDLVTLLWEKDFNHIKYLVVDDLLDVDVPHAEDIPDDWDFNHLLHSEIALSHEENPSSEQKTHQNEEETKKLLEKLKEFSAEEIEKIHKLLELDEYSRLLDDFFTILGEILITEENISEFDELVKSIERTLYSLINVGDFDSASKIIRRLRRFEQATRDSSTQADLRSQRKAERIKKAIDQAGEEEKLRSVGLVLNEKESIDLSKAKEYLLSLNWNSISPILHLLRELKHLPARKIVCQVLEEVGKDHLGIVGQGVYDSLWYVVRNVALVLGRIGKEEGVKFLKNIINHPDFRVRKEVITSLTKIGGTEAQALLVSALDDEDRGIRLLACRGLAQRKEKGALPTLMKIIQSAPFIDEPAEEKKQLFESLAIIGEDEVIPFLKKLVCKRNWLKRDKHNETRIFAIRAFGFIKTQKAGETLKELSQKRNKVIRQACQSALRKMDSGLIPEKELVKTV
ncbi:MAG: HEAT repeat domain-containing protein [candidate division Zixibacteria bacterium]|nr:HEAT repeat domain-containing protein [candidate division Zixibacteria bacterium]